MRIKSALIGLLPLLFFSSVSVFAAPEDFVITEIMYNPKGADGDKEWVEVFNNSTDPTTILGGSAASAWRFYDGSGGSGNHTLSSAASQGSMIISPKAYFVLAENFSVFKSAYPDFSGTLIEVSAMSLGNTSETLGFRIGSAGSLFSTTNYDKSWGGADNGESLEKKNLSGSNDSGNWVGSFSDGGSPGEAYKDPPPIIYPTTVKINEFLPDPLSGDEWVELYNQSSTEPAILSNWQLDDIEGGSSPQTFSATLAPLSYALIYFSSSKLNNDGDSVRLIRPDGSVADSFNYSSGKKGQSYAFQEQSFVLTATPTPGLVNAFLGSVDKFEGRLVDIKRLSLGANVGLTAFVTVPENILGKKDFYVSDGDVGIKISYSQENDPSLKAGDEVRVGSSLEESNQEKYIKTDLVTILSREARLIKARRILTGEADEPLEGMLVRVQGKLVEQSGETFYLDDGSGRAKIFLRDSTGIIKIKMSQGDEVWAVGLISQYGFLKSGDGNYRVMPRFQGDVYNLTEGQAAEVRIFGAATSAIRELPRTGPVDFYTLGWLLIFLGLKLKLMIRYSDEKLGL